MAGGRDQALPRAAESVAAARRLLADWLSEADVAAETAQDMSLVVSELVTNAVLHSTGEHLHLSLHRRDGVRRLVVADHYAGLPVRRNETGRSVGHGLLLLQSLADAWGVEQTADGKAVWAEFGTAAGAAAAVQAEQQELLAAETDRFRREMHEPEPTALVTVELRGLPLVLFARQLAQHRELLRELALVARSPRPDDPAPLVELARELQPYRGMAESTEAARGAALAAGEQVLDVTYRLPVEVGAACGRLRQLLATADEFARDGALLALPATPQEVEVREWFLCQIAEQCDGVEPRAWDGPLR